MHNDKLMTREELEKAIDSPAGWPRPCCGAIMGDHRNTCPLFDPTSLLARSMKAIWDRSAARKKAEEESLKKLEAELKEMYA